MDAPLERLTALAPGDRLDVATSPKAEFRRGWHVVLGCTLGGAVGVASLPNAVVGLLMHDLQADLGWSRGAISLAPTILFATLALCAPLAGWIADRAAEIWMVTASLMSMCIGFLLFSRMNGDIRLFYAGFAAIALVGAGTSPLAFAKIISARFEAARGMALGLAMVGNGLAGAVISMLLVPFSAAHGWRNAYLALAALVAVAIPVIFVLLRSQPRPEPRHRSNAADDLQGLSFAEAIRSFSFWAMAAAFAAISLAAMGFALHYVAFMIDGGLTPQRAAVLGGMGGIGVVVGRLATGWLIDRFFAPYVACGLMLLAAACFVALAVYGVEAAALGAVAIGLSIGAEIDLIGYMTGRYFGMRAYGRCYGLLYACILVGSTLSPLAYGMVFDAAHGYAMAFSASAALLLFSAVIMLAMPRFPLSPTSQPLSGG